nr:piggyBac transposable element-derived protein 4-like [Megalopta genalis]XP_033331633.1 piggyBac transposable element-derived protein 4-like [Megalopta genalis]XP_033332067.1 piggyBac transposable element-derived protein 4-like [Megalopta genalis]
MTTMRRSRNRIISDSSSESESAVESDMTDEDVPLCERWKNILRQRKWNIPTATQNFTPQVWRYSDLHHGVLPQSGISEDSSFLQIFKFFFCEELIELIVKETNKYSRKQGFSRSQFHVSSNDLHCFFAIIIHMSIVRLPKMSMYWNTKAMYNFVFIRQIMSKKKFFNILRFLHFTSVDANNNEIRKTEKIQSVMDILICRFQMAYRPRQNIVVDESLLLWKGRLSFKQYISSKRARFGVKSFILAESETGYIYNLKLYDGRISNEGQSRLGKSGSIVMNLSRNLLNEGRTIYLDNWYTSPALYEELHKYKTHACGTVRMNRRGLPCDEKIKKIKSLNKGELTVRYNKFMTFSAWKDKRVVALLSTVHTPELVATDKVDKKTGQPIKKPNVVLAYNMHMGAVDHTDQILHGIGSFRKTIKCY